MKSLVKSFFEVTMAFMRYRQFNNPSVVFFAIALAVAMPFLPIADAAVKRASMAPDSYHITVPSSKPVSEPFDLSCSQASTSTPLYALPLGELLSEETVLSDEQIVHIKNFLAVVDGLEKQYTLSKELAELRQKLRLKIGDNSPFVFPPPCHSSCYRQLLSRVSCGRCRGDSGRCSGILYCFHPRRRIFQLNSRYQKQNRSTLEYHPAP